jgi:plastocyanin
MVQTDHPQPGRTFAMTVFSVGNWVLLATMIYFVVGLALPLAGDPGAPPIPPFIVAIAIFTLIGVLSVWSGAARRSWFWLVAALPATLILVFNAPFIAHDVTRPAITPQFLVTVGAVAGGLATIVGGIVAFREVRRGQPAWTASGPVGWVSMAVIGVAVGAVATSILAGLAPAGGGEITATPTVTGVLTAERTAFVETPLQMKDGEVLGLFVTNRDDIAHTLDIDSLDIHVDLPANSTSAVAIQPSGPGTLEFFCAVPGHREAGMVGTIDVTS